MKFSVNEITAMWKRVMSFNFTLTLFRNETINVFKLAEETLDRQKSGAFSKRKFLPFDWSERKVLKTKRSKNDYTRCRKESSTKCRNSSSWKTKLFTWSFERSSSHSRRWTGTYRTSSFIGFWTFILFQVGFHGPTGSEGVPGQVREMVKRDEIVWFIRHSSKENQNKKTAEEDFRDSKISELISSVIQLRTLVQKHSGNFLIFMDDS